MDNEKREELRIYLEQNLITAEAMAACYGEKVSVTHNKRLRGRLPVLEWPKTCRCYLKADGEGNEPPYREELRLFLKKNLTTVWQIGSTFHLSPYLVKKMLLTKVKPIFVYNEKCFFLQGDIEGLAMIRGKRFYGQED